MFAWRGRRLVYSYGIYVLAGLCASLLVLFGGVTDRLIPLFAVGAFLAFTLSQAGMVMHWTRSRSPRARFSMLVNGLGAAATAMTVVVVIIAKFREGAWVTVLLIPAIILLMETIHRHYVRVDNEIATSAPLDVTRLRPPLVVVPIRAWDKVAQKALRFGYEISPDVRVVHVRSEEDTEDLRQKWADLAAAPATRAGVPAPELIVLHSPYRYVIPPILDYVLELERKHPDREVAVLIPEMVEAHWYHYLLHNQRAEWLKALLLLRGNARINTINVPWYLKA
jgi:hypothetical protein